MRFHDKEEGFIPESAQPATVEFQRSYVVLTGYGAVVLDEEESSTHQSFAEFCKSFIHEDARWAVPTLQYKDVRRIAEAIINGTAVAVSDGSFAKAHGTAAWIIQDDSGSGEVGGSLVVPGYPSDQSAYRSELAGLYAILIAVETICVYFDIHDGSIEVACDGESALNNAITVLDHDSPGKAQFDIIGAIWQARHRSSIQWKFRHVKGHQDDDANAIFDRWALLNIRMDAEAKAHWQRTHRQTHRQIRIYGEPWRVWINGCKAATELSDKLIDRIEGAPCLQYWVEKGRFGSPDIPNIDWGVHEQAMKSARRARRVWVTKQASGYCGTGRMMARWKLRDESTCPRCGVIDEDMEHVLRCQNIKANEQWELSLASLRQWLEKHDTHPELTELLCSRLSAWRNGDDLLPLEFSDPDLYQLLTKQDAIGWRACIDGLLVNEWAAVQASYFELFESRRSGKRWVGALIKKLWDTAWDMWDHRNRVVHDQETGVRAIELRWAIRLQFQLGAQGVMAQARCLFQGGVQKILRYPMEVQEAWLRRIKAARDRFERQQADGRREIDQMRNAMAQFLRHGRIQGR